MRRRATIAGFAALAGLVVAPRRVGAQSPTTLRVGGAVTDGLTPVLYGIQAGIFSRLGLDVVLESSSSGAALAAAVIGGSVDIANSSLMSLVTAYARGVKFTIVAGGALYTGSSPTSLVCALKSSGIASLADVDGKTIAVSSIRSLDQIGTMSLVDKAGGNSATLKFLELPSVAMLAALEQDRAELASITTPALGTALASGELRTFADPYSGIGSRFLIAVWFGAHDYVARNPSVARRFAAGMREAATYTNAHHAATLPLLAAYARIDPKLIATMNRLTTAISADPQEIQPAIDAAATYKFIDAAFPAEALL